MLGQLWGRSSATSIALLLLGTLAEGQQQRPMEVADIFGLEQLGAVVASPDGRWIAAVIARARTAKETYRNQLGNDVNLADIWLIPRHGGERRNITNGLTDQSGYWNPVWSPDGKRLAMLSTKGRDHIRPFVWEMATGTVRQVATRNVDLGAYGDSSFVSYGMLWSDSVTLLCPLSADNATPLSGTIGDPSPLQIRMVQLWTRTQTGLDPSVSVLESGREIPESARPRGQLVAIDVRSGISRVVADGNFRQILPSPTGRHLALIAETGRIPPRPTRKVPYLSRFRELWRTRLFMLSLEDLKGRWVDSIIDPKLMGEDAPHTWAPDGSAFAVIAKRDRDDETALLLWVVSPSGATARRVMDSRFNASASAWSLGGDLLAFAQERRLQGESEGRYDWWNVTPDAKTGPLRLTSQLKVVPPTIRPSSDPQTMLGIAGGELWSINARDGGLTNVTKAFAPKILDQVWPTGIRRNQRYHDPSIVQASDNRLYLVNLSGPSVGLSALPSPAEGAGLLDLRPGQRLTIFASKKSDGTHLWTGDGAGKKFDDRLVLNAQVAGIQDPKRVLLKYRGLDGDSLNALLVLPAGYQQGKRYPLATWVYPKWMVTDTSYVSFLYDKQSVSSLNLLPLISRGVGLLIPSLPVPPDGETGDPYLELPKGVMPAVDKAIELGFADPDRLVLMGHSFGGYATYSLLTYTHRFKAAVAMAGPSNLLSEYGEYWLGQRYYDYTHEELFGPALAESGQVLMGGPPWNDLFRYMRNSPISFADRVQTPLMIIQGDMDYVSMHQGEEFFNAMYRMGKEAQFVRYWGEGHVIESPANGRDMWRRIFRWLDEHLANTEPETPTGRKGVQDER